MDTTIKTNAVANAVSGVLGTVVDQSEAVADAIHQSEGMVSRIDLMKNGCCIINTLVQGACGEKSLPKVKVELDGEQIESDAIKGSKLTWFPSKPLNFVSKTSQRITRLGNKYGIRWGDMTVLPLERLDSFKLEFDAIRAEWDKELDELLSGYDDHINAQCDDYPNIAHLIRRYKMDKDEFRGRFKLQMLPPVAFKPLFSSEEEGEEMAESLTSNLFDEIAKAASEAYDKLFFYRDENKRRQQRLKANQKIRRPFKALIEKLNALLFLDPRIEKVVNATEDVLESLPKMGWIDGANLSSLARWTLVMSDVDTLMEHISDDYVEPETDAEPAIIVNDVLGEGNEDDLSLNIDEELVITDTTVVQPSVTPAVQEPEYETEYGFGFGF